MTDLFQTVFLMTAVFFLGMTVAGIRRGRIGIPALVLAVIFALGTGYMLAIALMNNRI